ncbi:hypothetical protein MK805_15115 [Shimazuella sp. AN120528]|nr:hypothetical protein [Shimazuella soli]
MGCKFEKFQSVSKKNLRNKEVEMHLMNGETIKLNLLNTEIFDMANGSVFVVGRAIDVASLDEIIFHMIEEKHWKP